MSIESNTMERGIRNICAVLQYTWFVTERSMMKNSLSRESLQALSSKRLLII